jgi:uncharacterized protein YbbK (DUF523 family)
VEETDLKNKIRIGVSSCLLGQKVRYDGGHKLDLRIAKDFGTHADLLAVCPEVECGLPVPQEPLRLQGDPDHPRLVGTISGADHTESMEKWTGRRIVELDSQGLCGFIFKSRSPNCSVSDTEVYAPSGGLDVRGPGLFARAFMERYPSIPVEDNDRLDDPETRRNFIERVLVYWRWNLHPASF